MLPVSFARGYEKRLSERGMEEHHRDCRLSIRLRAPPRMSDSSSIFCPAYGEALRGKSASVNTGQSDAHGASRSKTPISESLGSTLNGIAHIEGKQQTRTRTTRRVDSHHGPVGHSNHRRRDTRHLHSLLACRPIRRPNSPARKRTGRSRTHLPP